MVHPDDAVRTLAEVTQRSVMVQRQDWVFDAERYRKRWLIHIHEFPGRESGGIIVIQGDDDESLDTVFSRALVEAGKAIAAR